MSGPAAARLYTVDLLALAVELAQYPFDAAAPYRGHSRSRTCGSTLAVSFCEQVSGVGLAVTACAVGQAAAAIFARHCEAQGPGAIAPALRGIQSWLSGSGELPDWPDFVLLAAARDHPGRHEALMLPWKAALDALSSAPRAG